MKKKSKVGNLIKILILVINLFRSVSQPPKRVQLLQYKLFMYPLTIWPIPPQPPPLPIWTLPLYCLVLLLSWVSTLLSIPLTPPLVSWTPTLLERNITKLPVVSKRSCRTTNPFKISLLFWVSKGFSFTNYHFCFLKYISAKYLFKNLNWLNAHFFPIFNYCMYWSWTNKNVGQKKDFSQFEFYT